MSLPAFRIVAPRTALLDIRQEFFDDELLEVSEINLRPLPTQLVDRRPLAQMELWELVVSFVLGVGSNAAYDGLRAIAERRGDVVEFGSVVDGEDEAEGDKPAP
ncbi:MAG TPA: hypothetical protein VFI03_07750 [Solirubrobacterales bacterium]|nr:hypothetical protein [Solirubrobacterales bacterium]